jgi:hypothetical protein
MSTTGKAGGRCLLPPPVVPLQGGQHTVRSSGLSCHAGRVCFSTRRGNVEKTDVRRQRDNGVANRICPRQKAGETLVGRGCFSLLLLLLLCLLLFGGQFRLVLFPCSLLLFLVYHHFTCLPVVVSLFFETPTENETLSTEVVQREMDCCSNRAHGARFSAYRRSSNRDPL